MINELIIGGNEAVARNASIIRLTDQEEYQGQLNGGKNLIRTYSNLRELISELRRLNGSLRKLRVDVMSQKHFYPNGSFTDPKRFTEGSEGLERKADGSFFYNGEHVNIVFEQFFLDCHAETPDLSIDYQTNREFGSLKLIANYADELVKQPDGSLERELIEYALEPRKPDWEHMLMSGIKRRVDTIISATGVTPDIFIEKFGLYFDSRSKVDSLLKSVGEAEREKGAESPYSLVLMH